MLDIPMLIFSLVSLIIQILEYKNNSRARHTVIVIFIKINWQMTRTTNHANIISNKIIEINWKTNGGIAKIYRNGKNI